MLRARVGLPFLLLALAGASQLASCGADGPDPRDSLGDASAPSAQAPDDPDLACADHPSPTPVPPSEPARMAALEPAPRPRFAPLRVPGFRDAVVALPATVNGPRPLIVAVHGNYDRPEWHCELWRSVTGARGFVLCPRGQPQPAGKPSEDRWTYGWNPFDVEREIDAALRALRSEYGDEVDDGPAVYAGFSLGAIFGSGLIRRNPKRFARAVLIEGGAADWSLEAAKLYAIGGGQRVLFVCGQAACPSETIAPRVWLEMAHVKARTAYETSVGHTYDGPVAGLIARSWDWVVEGDERWSRTQ